MAVPDPMTERFDPAPAGSLRVAAWRHRPPTWPHPDLATIHEERRALLHWWADAYEVAIEDWGQTDAERPSEFVELLVEVSQVALSAGLGALATEFVRRFFSRASPARPDGGEAEAAPPDVRPLMAVTIVNQSGGTVIVRDAAPPGDVARALDQVREPGWRGRTVLP